ncbi:MAG: GNAT family N-acetyltransferase [Rhodospirillales bacterium]|nr:GNAT family N-acetyltransferase [Rhodospirillales bacterium]
MTELITERLIMRPFQADDINYLIHLKGSPTNMARTTVGPIDANAASLQLQQYRQQWKTRRIGVWSLTHKASGAFVGECGFVARDDLDDMSLRYTLCHGWWNQGLAPESVQAALAYGLGEGGLSHVSALALETNTRSCRILESAGMQRIETDFSNIPGFRHYRISKSTETPAVP